MTKEKTYHWDFSRHKRPSDITLSSLGGINHTALSSDVRCGMECSTCGFNAHCDMSPWAAMGSIDAWGEDYLTPEGVPDGDTVDPSKVRVPLEDMIACDIEGRPLYLYDEHELDAENEELLEEGLYNMMLLGQQGDTAMTDEEVPIVYPESPVYHREEEMIMTDGVKVIDDDNHPLENLPRKLPKSEGRVTRRRKSNHHRSRPARESIRTGAFL